MKFLRNLITNPHAILFVLAHWSLVLFLILSESQRADGWKIPLRILIIMSDLPAILLAKILWLPIQNILAPPNPLIEQDSDPISAITPFLSASPDADLFGEGKLIPNEVALISIITITLQWIIIGKIFSSWLASINSKTITLSLNDE